MTVLRIAKSWGFCDLTSGYVAKLGMSVWKGAPRRKLSNKPKNVKFHQVDQKLWSFEIASVHSTVFCDGFPMTSIS